MLPAGIMYPFEKDYEGEVEILYHRKDWGWRDSVMNIFGWRTAPEDQWKFNIETPKDVMTFIELTASWLDKEKWEDEGSSIWEYEEVKDSLIRDIINLSMMYQYMTEHPDVYLEFYDSY